VVGGSQICIPDNAVGSSCGLGKSGGLRPAGARVGLLGGGAGFPSAAVILGLFGGGSGLLSETNSGLLVCGGGGGFDVSGVDPISVDNRGGLVWGGGCAVRKGDVETGGGDAVEVARSGPSLSGVDMASRPAAPLSRSHVRHTSCTLRFGPSHSGHKWFSQYLAFAIEILWHERPPSLRYAQGETER
jgi:hypothetical protein